MSHLHTAFGAFGFALLIFPSLVGTSAAQQADPQPSIAERRAALSQRIDDLRSDIKSEENVKNLAQKHHDTAQDAIRQAIAVSRTPVAEQFMASNAMRDMRQAESKIRQLQLEIRGREKELRQLEVDERNRRQVTPVVARKPVAPSGKTPEQRRKIDAETQKLKGSWRGRNTSLVIDGNKARIYRVSRGVLQHCDMTIEVDPEKGFLDFHFTNGQACLQLYNLNTLENGKTLLIVQKNPRNMAVRPTRVLMLWEMDPLNGDVYEKVVP